MKISVSLSVCVTYYTINFIIKKNHKNNVGGRIITNYCRYRYRGTKWIPILLH